MAGTYNQHVNYNMHKLNKSFILDVSFHLTREWKFRQFIAGQLIKLAASILGCGIRFENKDNTHGNR